MKTEKTASEKFLKKYYKLADKNELLALLAQIPEKNYDNLKEEGLDGNWSIGKSGEKIIDVIKSGNNAEKKQKVDRFLKSCLPTIDRIANDIGSLKQSKGDYDDFTKGHYNLNGITANSRSKDKEIRSNFRYLLDALLNKAEQKPMEKSYFEIAKKGDSVWVVDDLVGNMQLDKVMEVFHAGKDNEEKYVHLKKSKMIIGKDQKHILFHKSDGARLNHALSILRPSTERDWIKHLPALMEQKENEPMQPPFPGEGR